MSYSESEDEIRETMDYRDMLLRHLAKTLGKRTSLVVSQDLQDAATDEKRLEEELVAAFSSLGFDAIPWEKEESQMVSRKLRLVVRPRGNPDRNRVSLEAKSKEKPGATVSAKAVGVSTIARQRDDYECQHAVVIAPEFPTKSERSALEIEITSDRESTGRTITLVRIPDLARLVRMAPARRIGLDRLRELFLTCSLPDEASAWIDKVLNEKVEQPPYREILEAIYAEAKPRLGTEL